MDFREITLISESDEREHWWAQTRFIYIDDAIKQLLRFTKKFHVLEFGCGTAQNLWYIRNRSPFRDRVERLVGVDPFLPETFVAEWLTGCDQLTKRFDTTETVDLILGMDVLEHIDDHAAALREWTSHLNSGGLILVTVPAFSFLWSQHDVALGHKRRYTKYQLLELAKMVGLEPVSLRYIFSFALPVVLILRKLVRRRSADFKRVPKVINFVLKLFGKLESHFGNFPLFGTSIVAVFRKQNGSTVSVPALHKPVVQRDDISREQVL